MYPFYKLIFFLLEFFNLRLAQIDNSRFGHTTNFVEGYLSSLENKKEERKLIFFFTSVSANKQIDKMVKRVLKISKIGFIYQIFRKCSIYWNQGEHLFFEIGDFALQKTFSKNIEYNYKGPKLNFSDKEKKRAMNYLENFGLKKNDKWICIHNRDSKYLDEKFSNSNSRYHDYRDFSVNSFEKAANFFSEQGYYVFRMGVNQKEKVEFQNKKIIDYSNSKEKNPFLDVFLLSNSNFYFGSGSGTSNVSMCFQRKCYGINYVITDFNRACTPYLFIFKKIRNIKTQKFLSLKEILESDFCNKIVNNDLTKYGHELVENTNDDVLSLGQEALRDSEGKNVYDEESVFLLNKFRNIYHKYQDKEKKNLSFLKVSPAFLKNNQYLLN